MNSDVTNNTGSGETEKAKAGPSKKKIRIFQADACEKMYEVFVLLYTANAFNRKSENNDVF